MVHRWCFPSRIVGEEWGGGHWSASSGMLMGDHYVEDCLVWLWTFIGGSHSHCVEGHVTVENGMFATFGLNVTFEACHCRVCVGNSKRMVFHLLTGADRRGRQCHMRCVGGGLRDLFPFGGSDGVIWRGCWRVH